MSDTLIVFLSTPPDPEVGRLVTHILQRRKLREVQSLVLVIQLVSDKDPSPGLSDSKAHVL